MVTLVTGAGGFIGGHLVKRLLADGVAVRAVDIKPKDEWYQLFIGADNYSFDLRAPHSCTLACRGVDRVYNLAADMGGMGYISEHQADCMLNVLISTNMLVAALSAGVDRFFYASSACIYPLGLQRNANEMLGLSESEAYPADPEDGYGWEKLFSERMAGHFNDEGLATRVARYHNVYGTDGAWDGGREKAPAALCRKIAVAKREGRPSIKVWGDGKQTRSFCYVDDCVEGTLRLMESTWDQPLNIGSDRLINVDDLADLIARIAGWEGEVVHVPGPQGVRGRNSDNTLCQAVLDWEPSTPLDSGLARTYAWIEERVCESSSRRPGPLAST